MDRQIVEIKFLVGCCVYLGYVVLVFYLLLVFVGEFMNNSYFYVIFVEFGYFLVIDVVEKKEFVVGGVVIVW